MRNKSQKVLSAFTAVAVLASLVSPLMNPAAVAAAGTAVTVSPASFDAATATDVTFSYTSSAGFASGDTITVTLSPAVTAVAQCATADTDADNDTTADGAFVTSASGAVYTFTGTAGTAISLCLNVEAAQGSYSLAFTDSKAADATTNDYGAALLYVGDDNDVTVSANIAPTLSFNIRNAADSADKNLCDLGTVNTQNSVASSSVDTQTDAALPGVCTYGLAVGTNAQGGFQVQIVADGELRNSNSSIMRVVNDTSFASVTSEAYGIDFITRAQTGRSTTTGAYDQTIYWGAYNNVENATFTWGTNASQVPTLVDGAQDFVGYDDGIAYTAGTDSTDLTLVTHGLKVSAGTPAGTYQQVVTYTVTANF